MKRILMFLVCALLLFGCSIKTKTESKISQTVGIVGITSIDTIILRAENSSEEIKIIMKALKTKKLQNVEMKTPDLQLTCINDVGKIDYFEINYKQSLYLYKGNTYKLDSKINTLLQEAFMN